MALLFMDGFDHYATADIAKKGWATAGTSPIGVTAGAGRRGGGALYGSSQSSGNLKSVGGTRDTLILGFAWLPGQVGGGRNVVIFSEGGSTHHVSVKYNADGTLSAVRGAWNGGTVLATTSIMLAVGTFYYLEIKAKIHDTLGTFELRVNGVPEITLSDINTRNGGSGFTDSVLLGAYTSSGGHAIHTFDDLYICDTSGSTNNDFLGDCRVDTLLPNADGTYSDFTPNSGSNHYSRVAEGVPDTTTYVTSPTADAKDTYTFQDLTAVTGTIKGIQVNNAALKDDAGARSIANVVRSGTTDAVGSTVALSTSQLIYSSVHETDPNTSAAWTEVGVNAMEAGVKVAV